MPKSGLLNFRSEIPSRPDECLSMEHIVPHMFAALHRAEAQFAQSQTFQKMKSETLSRERRKLLGDHLLQIRPAVRQLRREALRLQLLIARGNAVLAHRQMRLFYGLLEMLRPELQASLKIVADGGSGSYDAFLKKERVRAH